MKRGLRERRRVGEEQALQKLKEVTIYPTTVALFNCSNIYNTRAGPLSSCPYICRIPSLVATIIVSIARLAFLW